MEGDLTYGPGETQKTVPVHLLELTEKDGLLEDKQVKQFVMDLSNPRQGAKLGRYPRTTVTIADQPGKRTHLALPPVHLTLAQKPGHQLLTYILIFLSFHSRAQCDDVQKEHPEL